MTVVVMTTDAAQGMITASRTSWRPGNTLFRKLASTREMRMVSTTTDKTQMTVFSSTLGSAGSPSTWEKLSKPALPLSTPIRLIVRVEL